MGSGQQTQERYLRVSITSIELSSPQMQQDQLSGRREVTKSRLPRESGHCGSVLPLILYNPPNTSCNQRSHTTKASQVTACHIMIGNIPRENPGRRTVAFHQDHYWLSGSHPSFSFTVEERGVGVVSIAIIHH